MRFEIEEVTLVSGVKHYNLFGLLDGDVHSTLIEKRLDSVEDCRRRARAYLDRQVLQRKTVEKFQMQ